MKQFVLLLSLISIIGSVTVPVIDDPPCRIEVSEQTLPCSDGEKPRIEKTICKGKPTREIQRLLSMSGKCFEIIIEYWDLDREKM